MAGQNELLLLFLAPLHRLAVDYMVTGSMASMAYGEPRLTLDVDLVVAVRGAQAAEWVKAFPPEEFYCPPEEVIRVEAARERRGHFNIIHHATGFKADIYPVGQDPLHLWGMERRRRIMVHGVPVLLAPPEYVIVRKLEYAREGGSEKHGQDVAGMLRISTDLIDDRLVGEWAGRLGLTEEWERAKRLATGRPST